MTTPPPPTKRDIFAFFFFLLLWILPLGYYGITHHPFPGMPRVLNDLHNSSALFTNAVVYWPQYFVQFQFFTDGGWITYDHEKDFKLLPFGYRNRMNRVFEIFGEKNGNLGRWEIAAWLKDRYQKENPRKPLPIAVRFLTATNHLTKQGFTGHWKNKPLSAFLPSEIFVISTHEFTK